MGILPSKYSDQRWTLDCVHTSSYIIIHHHTRSSSSPSSILWIQASRQSIPVESLSGSQSSPSLLSGQDSPALSSPYLGLQGSLTLLSSQSFQNHSRRVHTSGPIVLGNPQRPIPSSLALLVPDLCHLVSIPWLILITRLTTAQEKRSSCVQPTGHSLLLSDVQEWSSLMPRQVDDLQIIPEQIIPHRCLAILYGVDGEGLSA